MRQLENPASEAPPRFVLLGEWVSDLLEVDLDRAFQGDGRDFLLIWYAFRALRITVTAILAYFADPFERATRRDERRATWEGIRHSFLAKEREVPQRLAPFIVERDA